MRYAIISDIHANEAALRAVLTDAADMRAERIVCLGDVLGYGPEPVQTLELIYRKAHVCLAGNHDDAVANRFPDTEFTPFAAKVVKRHRAALTYEALDWLRHLPYTCEFEGFACVHGDFNDPKNFDYVIDPEEAMLSWQERSEPLLFIGHTHKPGIFVLGASGEPHALSAEDFMLEEGKRYIVNPGSVGYPRSGVCRSSYCIYDDEAHAVYFRSLPFDLEGYAAKMHGQGLDEAPWVTRRALERRRPEVRNAAAFGKPDRNDTRKKLVLKRDQEDNVHRIDRPSDSQPLQGGEKSEGLSWTHAFVAAALILAVVGLVCTVRLVGALPKKNVAKELAQVKVQEAHAQDEAIPPSAIRDVTAFAQTQPLFGGWMAAFEEPSAQRVRIERNGRKNETVFRIDHAAFHTIRFSKRISLMSKPEKVYYAVSLLTTTRPGSKSPFAFTTRVAFTDAEGRLVGEEIASGKRSAKKGCVVPSSAEQAEFTLDCRCRGVYDLDVPYFGSEPMR